STRVLPTRHHSLGNVAPFPISDVEANLVRFEYEGAQNFSQLLFDGENQQLVVGGRDFIFRLDPDDLVSLDSHEWFSTNETIQQCLRKGQSTLDCRNYVTVLHRTNDSLLACGTNAFAPLCRRYSSHDLSHVLVEGTGVTKSPYSPRANITSVMTADGALFVGSRIDFGGNDYVFLRSGNGPLLRTPQYTQEYLNNPQFIASFEIGDFIYFFFREYAIEHMNCGRAVFSRVGRVCKNDPGSVLMKQSWTTFLKARLNCSLPGGFPFYFNEAHGVDYLPSQETFYVSFTTAENSIYGSAVCSYTLDDIETAFRGPLTGNLDGWRRGKPASQRFQCQAQDAELSNDEWVDLKRYQQTYDSVRSARPTPLYHANLERIAQLQVDEVRTGHQDVVRVLFVVTVEGVLKKIVHQPSSNTSCVIEQLHAFRQDEKLNQLRLVSDQHALYAATDRSVVKIPLSFCGRFESRKACLDAGDPYCGWDSRERRCSRAPRGVVLDPEWEQGHACAVPQGPVDGSWGRWSAWRECAIDGAPEDEVCRCRQRQCNSPEPADGGRTCIGLDLQVVNCTQHGAWTDWSEWSACSAQCGPGFQHRSRTCTNPRPAFGGRDCIGAHREERGCPDNPICHPPVTTQNEIVSWAEWGAWSTCSASCAGGFQMRRRQCSSQPDARQCELGCSKEYRTCNEHECPEVRSTPEWSDWHIVPSRPAIDNATRSASSSSLVPSQGWRERRFRYQCVARAPHVTSLRLTATKNERSCNNESNCLFSSSPSASVNATWTSWSAWGPCTTSCGGGVQRRERSCTSGRSHCSGHSMEEQQCNMNSCPIDGWSEWTTWSSCDSATGEQHRKRHCVANERWRCLGGVHSKESRNCFDDEFAALAASIGGHCTEVTMVGLTIAVVLGYAFGLATMVVVIREYNKRRHEETLIGSGQLANSMQGIPIPKHLASQPLVPAENNTYVPSTAFKGQFSTANSQTSSPVKGAATIKRTNTFRAQIGDDQNF
ncbi:semaphorin-5A-like, partial [Tropilaelaps mercedesae]